MRTTGKIHAAAVIAVAAASACHDASAPEPVGPRKLEVVGSTNQYVDRGDDAPFPFRVRVLGSDGKPSAGTLVRWAAPSHAALVDPPMSTTDPLGQTSAWANQLAATGTIQVTASVDKLAPVSFTIFSLDPCLNVNAHMTRVDSVVHGVLRSIDCEIDDGYYDFYMFSLPAQRAVTLDAKSQAFDPVVYAFEFATGDGWGANADDTHSGETSLRMILPGGYNGVGIGGYSPEQTGPYTLTVRAADEDVSGCDEIVIARGIDTRQRLDAGDCSNEPDPGWHDAYFIFLWKGQGVTVAESSTDFIPRLRISDASGAIVAESTGGAADPAAIEFVAPASANYLIAASSVGTTVGTYTLSTADAASTGGPLLSPATSGAGRRSWQPTPRFPRRP